jgi:hypothetical protein
MKESFRACHWNFLRMFIQYQYPFSRTLVSSYYLETKIQHSDKKPIRNYSILTIMQFKVNLSLSFLKFVKIENRCQKEFQWQQLLLEMLRMLVFWLLECSHPQILIYGTSMTLLFVFTIFMCL